MKAGSSVTEYAEPRASQALRLNDDVGELAPSRKCGEASGCQSRTVDRESFYRFQIRKPIEIAVTVATTDPQIGELRQCTQVYEPVWIVLPILDGQAPHARSCSTDQDAFGWQRRNQDRHLSSSDAVPVTVASHFRAASSPLTSPSPRGYYRSIFAARSRPLALSQAPRALQSRSPRQWRSFCMIVSVSCQCGRKTTIAVHRAVPLATLRECGREPFSYGVDVLRAVPAERKGVTHPLVVPERSRSFHRGRKNCRSGPHHP